MDIKKFYALLISAIMALNILPGVAFAEEADATPAPEAIVETIDEEPVIVEEGEAVSDDTASLNQDEVPAEDAGTEQALVEDADVEEAVSEDAEEVVEEELIVNPEEEPVKLAAIEQSDWYDAATELAIIYEDAWNGAKATVTNGARAQANQATRYGDSGSSLRMRAQNNDNGTVTIELQNGNAFSTMNPTIASAVADNNAYFGFWYYTDPATTAAVTMTIDGSNQSLPASGGNWKFVYLPVSVTTAGVTFALNRYASPATNDVYLDKIGIYMGRPTDTTPVVTPVFYKMDGTVATSTTQGVAKYFDIGFNYPVADENAVTVTVNADVTIAWVDAKTIRVSPAAGTTFDFSTDYQVTVTGYENIYGGTLATYSFAFRTQDAPVVFTPSENVGSGSVTSATVNGTLKNNTGSPMTVKLFGLAKVDGQTIDVALLNTTIPANGTTPIDPLSFTFDAVNASALSFSYVILDGDMLSANILVEKPTATMIIGAQDVSILGNELTVSGIFSVPGADRAVTAAVVPVSASFNAANAITVFEGVTDADGSFELTEALYDGLASGDYTVFVWGEGATGAQSFDFHYSSIGDRMEVATILKGTNAAEILACLNNPAYEAIIEGLGILIADYSAISDDESKEAIAGVIATATGKTDATLKKIVNAAIILEILNTTASDKGATLLGYAANLEDLSENAKTLLAAVASNVAELSAILGTAPFANLAALDAVLTSEAMIVLALNEAPTGDAIRALFATFKNQIGLDAEALIIENDIYHLEIPMIFEELLDVTFTDMASVRAGFNVAMNNHIEGVPSNAKWLLTMFGDNVVDGYFENWQNFNAPQVDDFVKVGERAVQVKAPGSNDTTSMGAIFRTKALSDVTATRTSIAYGSAYVGAWVYIPSGAHWMEICLADTDKSEHSRLNIDLTKTDRWQFAMARVERDVRYAIIKIQGTVDCWFDEIQFYDIPPADPTATVTGYKFYDQYNVEVDNQNQFISSYFDVEYNFVSLNSLIQNVKIKNNVTQAEVAGNVMCVGNAVRITPATPLDYDTNYTVTIGKYENVFGGRLENVSFGFKTGKKPFRFEDVVLTKGTGNITSASLTGTLHNEDTTVTNLTVYLMAKVNGEVVGITQQNKDFRSTTSQPISLNVTFPETADTNVVLSYCIMRDSMVPIEIITPQRNSVLTMTEASILGKNVTISGKFANEGTRAVTAAIASGTSTYYAAPNAKVILQGTTNADGTFTLTTSLYDGLASGNYTIFLWGEGAVAATGVIPLTKTCYYASGTDRGIVMAAIASNSVDTIVAMLTDPANDAALKSMGLLKTEFDALTDMAGVAQRVIALPATDRDTEAEAIAALNTAIATVRVKESQNAAQDLVDYADELKISERNLKLIKSIIEDNRSDALNALVNGNPFTTPDELNAIFDANLLLLAINTINNNNHTKMRALLNEHVTELGFNADQIIAANYIGEYNAMLIYQGMIGQNFQSLTVVKQRFDGLVAEYKPASGNGGGGNNGGASYPGLNPNGVSNETGEVAVVVPIKQTSFGDIQSHWAEDSITYLYQKGIIKGKSDAEFCPNDYITREEFVQLLMSALGLMDETATASFSDVPAGRWSYVAVASAYKHGIVSGYADGSFGAVDPITREDMAVMIYNALKVAGKEFNAVNAETAFADNAQISGYAQEAVAALRMYGIVNGVGDNQFMPKNYSTRAEAAQMIYGLIK